jgi:hypothetical protein
MHSHSLDAKASTTLDHTTGDLSPVCNQNLVEELHNRERRQLSDSRRIDSGKS